MCNKWRPKWHDSATCDVLLKVCNVYRLFNNITATRAATKQCRSEYVFAWRESLKKPVDLDLHCQGWTQRGRLRGALQAEDLKVAQALSGSRKPLLIGGGPGVPPPPPPPGNFFKIYVSENAFQAILKPFFPYSITSVLSKVRHSNPSGVLPIFSHIRRRKLFFGVQNFDFWYFLGFSEKWIFFWVWSFCGYFRGLSQNWAI